MTIVPLILKPLMLMLALGSGALEDPNGDGPPRPPPEAVEACADKASGDACSFAGREGDTVDGSCFAPDADKPLACRPDHPPPR
ncbi:hypothetical protein ENSA5_13670 [Enhygromyxa salina]|uniref:Uncharacterized protein n=1 Tax=Enhygromyxa salina TaxID=215803 RepID=A0A2S9YEX5_9BACT|nr:hypothetical protein [Enhygromyxa salina]PRQ03674.1 hypothetical protein ENSA5_13670 [Enhygromyxa salina]